MLNEVLIVLQKQFWTLFSIAVGAVITWYVARRYYIQAAIDLEEETKVLRNLLRITLTALEDAKMVKLVRDESGQITGRYNELRGDVKLPLNFTVSGTMEPGPSLNKVDGKENPK